MTESQRTILLIFVITIFAYQGYRRGFLAELVKFVLIMLGIAVNAPTAVGQIIVAIINQFYFFFLFFLNGGLAAMFGGEADFAKIQAIVAEVQGQKLIDNSNRDAALFFLMLMLVLLGYIISARVERQTNPLLGLFLGVVNGLILAYLFIAPIAGETLLPNLPGTGMFDDLMAIFKMALEVILVPFKWLYGVMGPWFFVAIIVSIILIAARDLRR